MRRALQLIKGVLSDDNQVILAVIALILAVQDVFFGVTPEWFSLVEWIQFGIILVFLLAGWISNRRPG